MEEEIKKIIDELRPYLMNDGGNIEFVKYENNICYVTLQGACAFCSMQDFTLKNGIEQIIKERIPEIKEVRLINNN